MLHGHLFTLHYLPLLMEMGNFRGELYCKISCDCLDIFSRLDLWNLNSDTEVATASIYVGASQAGESTSTSGVALNRLSW